ncbi:MAG: zinc ribbon domain-containing protein [Caldilinea sp.]|nr:zinc-ribbon domain-containing protein [Caldilinea sp.]MCB0133714.1 zinc-ribbon domain-containing protein [Caldilineaceae bacterium]MCB9140682.1 zinc-ribbon domain-containing protein [Anaerolineales bacterium]MCB0147394.1 zinc-ribbon domain-containing protein [Caldilineaceae bacterium]MCB9120367.1 zinc-ribbon domain-containing protein [Caldilineaceae bacterium]
MLPFTAGPVELIILLVLPLGLLSLFLGRKLFWLFVGISGFLLGLLIGGVIGIGNGWDWPVILLVGLLLGAGAAVLSIYLQKPMASLAGFMMGGLLAVVLYMLVRYGTNIATNLMFGGPGPETWILFLVGGVAAAVFVWVTYEWALIVLSSLSGALLTFIGIAPFLPFNLPGIIYLLILAGLAAVGIYVQAQMLSKTQAVVVVPAAVPAAHAASYQPLPPSSSAAQTPSGNDCPQCGAPVRPGAKFCNRCGATVGAGSAP